MTERTLLRRIRAAPLMSIRTNYPEDWLSKLKHYQLMEFHVLE